MVDAAQRLTEVRARIAKAANLARRSPDDVTLVAVTKGRELAEIEPLIQAGQRDFGESRVQEALAKWPTVLARHPGIRLHAIGRLQSNKADEAVRLCDVIHSLDRLSLLDALARESDKTGRAPGVCVQVNIGDEPQKGGCAISETGALIEAVRKSPLPLAGLMAIPPLGLDPSPYFALLAEIANRNQVTGLSMGMSADFEKAVMLGATAIRVGSLLFDDDG
jgi:PLP dependent protein